MTVDAILKAFREGVEYIGHVAVDLYDPVMYIEISGQEFEGVLVADCLVVEFGGRIDEKPHIEWVRHYA